MIYCFSIDLKFANTKINKFCKLWSLLSLNTKKNSLQYKIELLCRYSQRSLTFYDLGERISSVWSKF